ncbi:MAG: N-6 DNA methylase [Desulfurococcales archaeon]|nr:N-6 DNA methylase [Desulfurococcales archaeon]
MCAGESITERSLYPVILDLAKHISNKVGITFAGASEVKVGARYPDIILQLDSYKLLVQIKIDTLEKMLSDLTKTYPTALKYGAGLLLLLFSPEVKEIRPAELEKVAPLLRVKRAIMLAPWISKHVEETELENILKITIETLKQFIKAQRPFVDYLTIAYVSREAVEELATVLRENIFAVPKLLDQAQAIIGSFDFYKALLSEAIEKEEIMKTYIADIIAYLTVLYLLFLHIVSTRKYNYTILPQIKAPLQPPQNLIDSIINNIKGNRSIKDYHFIVEPFIYILELLKNVEKAVSFTLARYIYAIQVLRPEHVREELFGRIYQEGLPPETRKNLGAFFTNPIAARILAYLAIDKWDEKVLDPACGSGTLLASAYEAKMERASSQGIDKQRAHELFLKEHITGIDIMQFATKLTSINLTLQNIEVPIEPKILWGDGIEKMITALGNAENGDPPQQVTLYDYIIMRDREKYEKHMLSKEEFDVVIMNPPFTRRERIPRSERNKLDKMLGDIVKGKVGYWAYFFAASDYVVKLGGKLAAVTPEEFFVGSSAESIRRYLLKGEQIDKNGRWNKVTNRIYIPQIIIKSAIDIAFSEQALYRDYLVVFKKVPEEESKANDKCVIVTLKKRLNELKDRERDIAMQIKNLLQDDQDVLVSNDLFDAVVLSNISGFIERYIDNLKPLVFFNSVKTLEFFYRVASVPGLKQLDEIASLRDYTCQYTGTGFEEYVRRLFISRYETKAPTISFKLVGEDANTIAIGLANRNESFIIPKNACVHSLRTYANVRHMDITGEEECAIINYQVINQGYLTFAGLIDRTLLDKAANDIKKAYEEIAGHILLARRLQLTSPNVYWLVFYSSNKIIGPSAPMICLKLKNEKDDYYKALALYLNSSITFLQLLAYLAMTRGAWIAIHSGQAWSKVRVPDLESLSESILKEALQVFNEISKAEAELQPLYRRYTSRSDLQKKIDKIALKMIGLEWNDEQLNILYDVIRSELDVMQRILEESQRERKSKKAEESEDEEESSETIQTSLNKWINK